MAAIPTRALILDLLRRRPRTLVELTEAVGTQRQGVHRIVQDLERTGQIVKIDKTTRTYALADGAEVVA